MTTMRDIRTVHPTESHPFLVESESGSDLGWNAQQSFSCAEAAGAFARNLEADIARDYEPGSFSVRVNRFGSFEVRRREGSGWMGVSDHTLEQDAIDEAARMNFKEGSEMDIVETDIGQIHHFPILERVPFEPDGSGRWVVELWDDARFVGCLRGVGLDGQDGEGVHAIEGDRDSGMAAIFPTRGTAAEAAIAKGHPGRSIVVEYNGRP